MTLRGTLATLPALAEAAQIQAPAVIVVGSVAAMDLSPTLPLSGIQVALTGTASTQEKLRSLLLPLGAGVVSTEQVHVEALPCAFDLTRLTDGQPHWIVFTSAQGVQQFFRLLEDRGLDLRLLHACRFGVIGPGTGEALGQRGIFPDLSPTRYTSQDLAKALCQWAEPISRVFLFRSRQGNPALPALLSQRYQVEDIPLYDLTAQALPLAAAPQYLTFASASGVERYFSHQGAPGPGTRCVCIGPRTAEALEAYTNVPPLLAPEATVQGMVQAILADRQA
jgi:uroporphyrinogen III methyltransferase/synthase